MPDKVRFYVDLFRCRADVYAVHWENKRDGRSGGRARYLPLTPDVIDKHLRGRIHIGLYPLFDDHTCWWVAADFDKEAAMLDALAFMKAAREHGIPAALEVSQSGRGAHVWIFFAQPIVAATARRIATIQLGEAFRLRGSRHLCSYDETIDGDLVLPRGLLELVTTLVDSSQSTLTIDDTRVGGQPHDFTCSTELRHDQCNALRQVLKQDPGEHVTSDCVPRTCLSGTMHATARRNRPGRTHRLSIASPDCLSRHVH